jgi:streptothricin acetyltransferase
MRRSGVGAQLILRAESWARGRGLAGIALETQNVNAPACRFYRAMGFRIGGYDRYLYTGIDPDTREIAVFWYRHVR